MELMITATDRLMKDAQSLLFTKTQIMMVMAILYQPKQPLRALHLQAMLVTIQIVMIPNQRLMQEQQKSVVTVLMTTVTDRLMKGARSLLFTKMLTMMDMVILYHPKQILRALHRRVTL